MAPVPIGVVLDRIRSEYLEMPGLRLTLEQAQRLCGVEPTICKSVIDALVDAGFLCLKPDGHYARATDGRYAHPAKADNMPAPRVATGQKAS